MFESGNYCVIPRGGKLHKENHPKLPAGVFILFGFRPNLMQEA
jgi:hypothetical protein